MLLGGGHAHVAVLADWIENGLPASRATLLTPHRHLRYSGTVPGWISGQYDRDEGLVDLAGLAGRAGVKLVLGNCSSIDPDGRYVTTDEGERISFGVVSIDTGGVGRARALVGDDPRLLDIRPIGSFVESLGRFSKAERIAVIGGGAGGAELAFALRNRKSGIPPDIVFVAGHAGLLPDHFSMVRTTAQRELNRQGILVCPADARIARGELIAGDRSVEPVDLIVAALGSGAPEWPGAGGLATDEAGFIAVDRHQRSISHPHVFAVGDVAARQDREVPHSGVHAVFAGPVLAENLRAVMRGAEPTGSYRPRWHNLYLMSTGDGSAIASYGPFAVRGRWVSRVKHWIDKRWLRKYARLAKDE